jgi:predicted nucleic acid-binding protein
MSTCFADSTTLLYPLDRQFPEKGKHCRGWLSALRTRDLLILSPQVLNESYWVVLRKDCFAHARGRIRPYISLYMNWTKAPLLADTLGEAFSMEGRYGVRFWDALLLASANAAGSAYFLSEDLNDGQLYGAVRAINPFRHTPEDVLGAAARS